jgi:cystathionine gamma-lyase
MKTSDRNIIKNLWEKWGPSTKAIHIGNDPDEVTGAVIPPIFQTSTYVQKAPGVHMGYEYSRTHNPTRDRLQDCLAGLEGGNYAVVTASGLSAAMLMMHALPKGSQVLCGDDVYGGTYRLFQTIFHEQHQFQYVDTTQLQHVEDLLKKKKFDLLWLETPSNPLLKITDLKILCEMAEKYGVKVLVDNTFMSSYFQRPLELGADIVLHSMTKYLNGHSDVIGGCLICNDENLYQNLFRLQNSIGPTLSPFDCWLVLRGLKTLGVRMKAHEENARGIAAILHKHPLVENVIYPGLAHHPQHQLAKKQMSGFGGMLSFYLKGDQALVKKFLSKLHLFQLAESLGGVESLVGHPASMTHASIPKEIREPKGITDNLVRLSVGIEDTQDLLDDVAHALETCV